jgi:hypothetical protein
MNREVPYAPSIKKECFMRFKVVITYDSEYDGYVVDVPELP